MLRRVEFNASENLQEWRMNGKYFKYGKHLIFYKDEKGDGDADPILLIHGYPTNSHDWHKIWHSLKKYSKRVICFDQLGFGWSDKPNRNSFRADMNLSGKKKLTKKKLYKKKKQKTEAYT